MKKFINKIKYTNRWLIHSLLFRAIYSLYNLATLVTVLYGNTNKCIPHSYGHQISSKNESGLYRDWANSRIPFEHMRLERAGYDQLALLEQLRVNSFGKKEQNKLFELCVGNWRNSHEFTSIVFMSANYIKRENRRIYKYFLHASCRTVLWVVPVYICSLKFHMLLRARSL